MRSGTLLVRQGPTRSDGYEHVLRTVLTDALTAGPIATVITTHTGSHGGDLLAVDETTLTLAIGDGAEHVSIDLHDVTVAEL